MAQWQISLTDPTAPEGSQLVGFIAVEGDWPEEARPLSMLIGPPCLRLDALILGPVPEMDRTPDHLTGRLLRTRDDVEAAGGIWPYDSEDV